MQRTQDGTVPARKDAQPGGSGPDRRAVFRIPAPALLVVFLLFVSMIPLAFAAPGLQVLLAIPVGLTVWIVRGRTTGTRDGLTVRTVLGTRELPWSAVKGLSITSKAKVGAVLGDDSTVPLPGVRPRHLPVLSLVSDGRLPDPSGVLDGGGVGENTADTDGPDSADGSDEGTGDGAGDTGSAENVAGNPGEHRSHDVDPVPD